MTTTLTSKDLKDTVKIEDNISIESLNAESHYGFIKKMNPGQSFFLDAKLYDVTKAISSIRSWGYKNNITISTRQSDAGARIWRT